MRFIINPGTGPVANTTEQNAIENMRHFVTDIDKNAEFVRIPDTDYGEGRYAFLLWMGNRCHEIQMPGLPLHGTRYIGSDDQNPFDYPRLYVDGGSGSGCLRLVACLMMMKMKISGRARANLEPILPAVSGRAVIRGE